MAQPDNGLRLPVNLPKADELTEAWRRLLSNYSDALRSSFHKTAASAPLPAPFDPFAPFKSFADLGASFMANPAKIVATQNKLFGEWTKLWTSAAARGAGMERDPLVSPARGDRRFSHEGWQDPTFDYLKQAYLLFARQSLELVEESGLEPASRTRAEFYTKQMVNALSPANFAFTNPEAIRKALDTGGVSLVSGLANMLADAASPSGLVSRRSEDDFEIGVSIAATPGGVIFQNELMQLIQYMPATDTVYRRPLLYIPPLVNKYYVLDLQPESSMIKWLVDQGHTVFVTAWVNPGSELGNKGIGDYAQLGPIAALQVIEEVTGVRDADVFGFCMGGTLLAIAAAYLYEIGEGDRIGSLTTIGTLLEFSDTGEWATFYEPAQMEAFERHVEAAGVIGADKLQALFSVVRANDLIWSSVVNHYLLDKVAPASDLLFWFADGSRIPKAFLLEYGKWLLRDNALKDTGGVTIAGVPISLAKIVAPTMTVSLKDDHVTAWRATYESAKLYGGERTFLLGGSGHNAGVINPPAANRHGYWTNNSLPETGEEWLTGAQETKGSWWPAWQAWLVTCGDGKRVKARAVGSSHYPQIEPAPGSYVRVKA